MINAVLPVTFIWTSTRTIEARLRNVQRRMMEKTLEEKYSRRKFGMEWNGVYL